MTDTVLVAITGGVFLLNIAIYLLDDKKPKINLYSALANLVVMLVIIAWG